LRSKPTSPKYFQQIFERGIDPDVEDPEQCHTHSEIPDEWPPLNDILDYQERVRNRARSILQNSTNLDRSLAEALWIGFEHEAMHLETFLYMLLQSDRKLPPTGVDIPNFAQMAQDAKKNAKPNQWFRIPKQTLTIGLDDSDGTSLPKDSFGWDNEKPQRIISVHSFEAQARPITNGEYARYIQALRLQTLPASWVHTRSEKEYPISQGLHMSHSGGSSSAAQIQFEDVAVRTVFGPVPLEHAQDWPLVASYDEFANYAKWMECRIPTFEETRSIYMHSEKLRGNTSLHDVNGHRSVKSQSQLRNQLI
jgi:formylglycine-generating enzyme required for sulfatase activity